MSRKQLKIVFIFCKSNGNSLRLETDETRNIFFCQKWKY